MTSLPLPPIKSVSVVPVAVMLKPAVPVAAETSTVKPAVVKLAVPLFLVWLSATKAPATVTFAVAPLATESISAPLPKSVMVSIPSTVKKSAPAPPVNVLLPEPPFRLSSPAPPLRMSSPVPPSRVSDPAPPFSVSSPAPPFRRSLPEPPVITSLPLPPIKSLSARLVS